MDIKKFIEEHKDVIPYLFFGVCTTIVNVGVYWVAAHLLHMGVMPSTIVAWIVAVLFAYITNRIWVFKSTVHDAKGILREMFAFFGCRLATGVVDWLCMYIFVDKLEWNDVIMKFVANIIVIILNYVASKLIIFRKG